MTPRLSHIFNLAGVRENGVSAHGLRKFWEQNVHASKESYVKQLNGRALSKSEKAYDWLTREQLFDIYKQNYPQLECLSPTQTIKQEDIERIVEQRVAERTAHLQAKLNGIRDLQKQVEDMASRIGKVENNQWSAKISDLEEFGKLLDKLEGKRKRR